MPDPHPAHKGRAGTPIRTARTPHKILGCGGSLAGRVTDPFTLYGWLVRNIERLNEELEFEARLMQGP